jgi:hypothetical protein
MPVFERGSGQNEIHKSFNVIALQGKVQGEPVAEKVNRNP